jgi:tetratricopeptide (TPR) repeat protein
MFMMYFKKIQGTFFVKTLFPLICLKLLLGCNGFTTFECREFTENYPIAYEQFQHDNDTVKLLSLLNRIIINDGSCIDALLTRGDLLTTMGSDFQATKDYLSILSRNPQNTYALYRLGIIYQLRNSFDSSVKYFQKSIESKSIDSAVIDYKGGNKKLETTKSKYDLEYAEIVYQLAITYYYQRDLPSALEAFSYCIEKNYIMDKAYLYRAAIKIEMKKIEDACKDLSVAKKLGNVDSDELINQYCK